MAITINSVVAVNTHTVKDGNPSPTSELALLSVGNITYKGRYLVNVLEELFSKIEKKPYTPVSVASSNKWQKFTSDGTFVVPEGVTRVLVLVINAGMATSGSRRGGVLVSRYVNVTPGESIPVEVGQSTSPFTGYVTSSMNTTMISAFNNRVLRATYSGSNYLSGYIVVDDVAYLISSPETALTEALKEKGVVTIGRAATSASSSSNSRGTAGTGGFNVEQVGTLAERSYWLSVARDMPPIALPFASRNCYPDTTQLAGNLSGKKAGKGANYGGAAGCWANGSGYVSFGERGGQGLVCVFWGDDIETKTAKDLRRTNIGKLETDGSITPLVNVLDAKDIPYGDGTLESVIDKVMDMHEEPVVGFIEQPTLKLAETVTLEVPRTSKHYKKFLVAQILPGRIQETTSALDRKCTMAAAFAYYEGSEDSTTFTVASYREDSLAVGYAFSIFAGSVVNNDATILRNGLLRSSGSSSILDPRPVMYVTIKRNGKYGYAIQNGAEEEIRKQWLSILTDTPRDSVGGSVATVSSGGAAAWPYSGENRLPNYSNVYPAGDCTYGYGNWIESGNANGAFFIFWGDDIDALYDQHVTGT